MIIAFCGLIGSGKDTAADILVKEFNFQRESFAGTLKDAVAAVFGWPRHMLEGQTAESRQWREEVDAWWAKKLDMPNLTPRWVLQYWGTDVLRKHFHNDIWLYSLENKLRKNTKDIVISDARFPNELDMISNTGGHIFQIVRGQFPEWYNLALAAKKDNLVKAVMQAQYPAIHESEWAWIGHKLDGVIFNSGTLEEFTREIKRLGDAYTSCGQG